MNTKAKANRVMFTGVAPIRRLASVKHTEQMAHKTAVASDASSPKYALNDTSLWQIQLEDRRHGWADRTAPAINANTRVYANA